MSGEESSEMEIGLRMMSEVLISLLVSLPRQEISSESVSNCVRLTFAKNYMKETEYEAARDAFSFMHNEMAARTEFGHSAEVLCA